ncbi:MAG: hypothetical protein JOY71_19750 [Acetobacteraceae bacterium]|nr:hypothetical protein [Acetobacteraceae bacterium]MBV8589447.1 hypothetical protein [Acetobacteraceae bacterium]
MPETEISPEELLAQLRARTEALETQLTAVQRETQARLIRSELKAEAIRVGIVDLDGLKLLDTSSAKLNERGEVEGISALISQFKRAKPWLFGHSSSSSTASAPAAQAPRQKLAKDMTEAEWRAARAELIKRR